MDVEVHTFIQAHIQIKVGCVCAWSVCACVYVCSYVFIHAHLASAVNCFFFIVANTLKYRLTLLIWFYGQIKMD